MGSDQQELDEILRARVKVIGDNEWTLLGYPDELIKSIEAYVTTRVKEELEKVQNVCESHNSEFAFNLANAIEDRVQALTTTTNGKEE